MKWCYRLAVSLVLGLAGRPGIAAQPIDPSAALAVFAERSAVCRQDGGRMWGVDLCGPILLVEPRSRFVVADRQGSSDSLQPQDGAFVGQLPANVAMANTALGWDDVHWAMLLWPLPPEHSDRLSLLMHESWHRVQGELGLPARSPVAAHLASLAGRVDMRLEWRALAAALAATTAAQRHAAIADALAFRRRRHGAAQGGGELERQLELSEGLAEYTGVALAGQKVDAVLARLAEAERQQSFARSFVYASGPAYGLLLDALRANWRGQLNADANLGTLLAEAAGIGRDDDWQARAQQAGSRYGEQEIRAAEQRIAAERALVESRWRSKLIEGPVLQLPFKVRSIQFNPSNLFPLAEAGTVYPTLQVIEEWGVLEVTGGALIDSAWSGVSVTAPTQPAALKGDGWTLALAPGWTVVPGARAGDLTVRNGN